MNVVMLSTDEKLLEEGSAVRERMIEYGGVLGGVQVVLLNKSSEKQTTIKISDTVTLHPTHSHNRVFAFFDAIRIGKKLKNVDVVSSQDPFENGFVAWRIACSLGVRLHFQIHTDFLSPYFSQHSLRNKIRIKLAQFLLSKADALRVVSERIKWGVVEQLQIPEEKVTVLPLFTEQKEMSQKAVVTIKEKYNQFDTLLVTIARLQSEKNLDMLLRVMRTVVEKHQKTGLLIVGSGPLEERLNEQARQLGIAHNVRFAGYQSQVQNYLTAADMYVHTSKYEGYGLSILEAALAGKAIVTSDVGLIGDVLDDGVVNICGVSDQKCFEKHIIRLLDFPEHQKELGGKSKKAAEKVLITKKEYLEEYKKSLQ